MLLTEASSRALALAVSRRRGRALADATRKAETALAAAFRKQGKILLDALPALKGRFAEALREGTAEDFEPLFDRAELATLDVVEEPLKELMREGLAKGARVGIADLKTTIAFDLAHPTAVAYVEDYGADLVRGINDTTRTRVRAIMARAVEEGWSYNATAKELTELYQGFAVGKPQLHIDSRAHLIAVQECLPGDTLIHPFAPSPSSAARLGLSLPRGRLSGQSLVRSPSGQTLDRLAVPAILGATRRWYAGDTIKITTTDGHQLTGTPNHPILTDRGWVGLGSLVEGDHVVCGLRGQEVGLSDPHVDDMPTTISQIFNAIKGSTTRPVQRALGSDMDFHGDGSEGEVEIVFVDGDLGLEDQAALKEPTAHDFLSVADFRTSPVSRGGPVLEIVGGFLDTLCPTCELAHSSFGGSMGVGQSNKALLGRAVGPHDTPGFGHTTPGDACPPQDALDAVVRDTVALSDALAGLAPRVSFDSIAFIDRQPFSGHVYNLLTNIGAYTANGIIVHNCGQAYEAGTMLVGQELAALGLEVEKSWLTLGDDRVSDICRTNAAAGWIPLQQSYPSGHERPLGHVACRCCGLTRMAPDAD